MADLPILKCAGLYTSVNEVSGAPEGALSQADNVVIRSKDIVEPRRGQNTLSSTFGSSGSHAKEIAFYGDDLILHYFNGGTTTDHTGDKLARYNGASFTDYSGTYEAPEPTLLRMKFAEGEQNFYFVTANGIYVLDDAAGTPYAAGVVKAGAPSPALASGTWFPTDSAVAYRIVWGRKDAHGIPRYGAPSGRAVVVNTSGSAKGASVTVPIPTGVTTSYYYRIFRSETSASATTTPSDEMYLVYENSPTSAEITAGSVTVADTRPEIILDPGSVTSLYTNPSSGGMLLANDLPPKARDLTYWSSRMWYANTERVHTLEFQLLAHAQEGDVFTIFGQSYSAEDAPTSGAPDAWVLDTSLLGGSPTSSQLIENAAQTLVYAINLRNKIGNGTANYGTLRAYYVSGAEESPGRILVEATDYTATTGYLGWRAGALSTNAVSSINQTPDELVAVTEASTSRSAGVVTVTTAAAHGFSVGDEVVLTSTGLSGTTNFYDGADANFPQGIKTVASVPSSTTFTYAESGSNATMSGSYYVHAAAKVSSSNDRAPNRLYFSKPNQPEAVPALNYLDVGVKNHAIYRVQPLRDRLYVFKPDGIFVVSGEYPFRVDLLDDTTKILAPDSVAPVNNQIYALTNQGVVAVSDAGVRIVSRPIERTLVQLGGSLDALKLRTFGVSYETERSYLLWVGEDGPDEYCGQAYVYNTATNAWTRWPIGRTCGRVSPGTDGLYLGHADTNKVWEERKVFTYMAYQDELVDTTEVSTVGTGSLTFGTTVAVQVGDLVRTESARGIVSEVLNGGAGVNLSVSTGTFSTAQILYVYRAIPCAVEWLAQAPNGPNQTKQFSEATFHFRRAEFYDARGSFTSDLSRTEEDVGLAFSDRTIPAFAWEERTMPRNKRVLIPHGKQLCSYLAPGFTHCEATGYFALNGVTLHYSPGSERNSR